MIKGILSALLFIFAALGICEFLHDLRTSFLSKNAGIDKFLIVVLKPGTALDQLKYAYEQYYWNGKRIADFIIALDSLIPEEEKELCREYSRGKDIVISPHNMAEHIINELSL